MTPTGSTLLERVRLHAPFGVRFWDPVVGAVVSDRLMVEVFPKDRPDRRVVAAANRSGVFAARGLPGLGAFEAGTGESPGPRDFVVEVTDAVGRFIAFAFTVTIPAVADADRLFAWEPTAPMVPLFSAPGRAIPSGLAVVRAQLVRADVPGPDPFDPEVRLPAPWAVLEVAPLIGQPAVRGATVRGLADERGNVAVVFPYPEPPDPPLGIPSPPPGPTLPGEREWKIEVRARFAPGVPAERPDLRAALAQAPARLWADAGRTAELTVAMLQSGGELVLRTAATGSPPSWKSELFITTP